MDDPQTALITAPSLTLEQAGILADAAAADALFADYQRRLAEETRRRHRADLALFTRYLAEAGVQVGDLLVDPAAWEGLTWGLVQGFAAWQLREGYAVSSVNVRLSTIKAYARVAAQAGGLSMEAYGQIQLVKGYRKAEARHLDQDRTITRRGAKKAKPRFLSLEEVARLKAQPNTPQGRRDAVLICLFLDHGLRCGELAALTVEQVHLVEGTLCFDRPKVDRDDQTHLLSPHTRQALARYLTEDRPVGPLLWGSRKGGTLTGGMSTRAITKRVKTLGKKRLGIPNLSAHDGRHTWTKWAVKGKTDLRSLMDAGGWSTPAMPLLYAESGQIANAGVQLLTLEIAEERE
jgi:integrase